MQANAITHTWRWMCMPSLSLLVFQMRWDTADCYNTHTHTHTHAPGGGCACPPCPCWPSRCGGTLLTATQHTHARAHAHTHKHTHTHTPVGGCACPPCPCWPSRCGGTLLTATTRARAHTYTHTCRWMCMPSLSLLAFQMRWDTAGT
jgi:hypothetical protein